MDDPYELPKKDDEWVESISSIRMDNKMTAGEKIQKNQQVQKKNYDSKVKRYRYAINITLFYSGNQVVSSMRFVRNYNSRFHELIQNVVIIGIL